MRMRTLAKQILSTGVAALGAMSAPAGAMDDLQKAFVAPPDTARPWVYWYFMDGNMTREGLTADLEAMRAAGIGGAIFLEVGIGIPRGPVEFMSVEWRRLVKHAVSEADRLGVQIALGAGPGWCGTGGPWVKPEQSMQHLVASETTVHGPARYDAVLPRPKPRTPFFGEGTLTPELKKAWQEFYQDEAVVAFPTPAGNARIPDIDEKALYNRAPYSSQPGVKPYLPAPAEFPVVPADQSIGTHRIVELTDRLGPDGRLAWDVPDGDWTILRFGRTATGQTTRPAPEPGLGFESDKFDAAALDAHFAAFTETLLFDIGEPKHKDRGVTTLHFDSWEMGSQNWSKGFRQQFKKRRGYDPLRYLPAMTGRVVESAEASERFLWDLRQTAQELVVENHARRLKGLGRDHGMLLSLEPYDLNPTADLNLGSVADVPMGEFWSKGFGFSTEYSCIEAASLGHTMGRNIVGAEAFTADDSEAWKQYPGSMKAQGDWALATGINRIVFHRYQHQPWPDRRPGMTMGIYGVHWERTQTWWDMVPAYHAYLSRCQAMLRQGLSVADILYLTPEGAPHVFRPPSSATDGDLPDRRGYNFDGIAPETLMARASVRDGRIVLPDGMSYRVLVLPRFDTMTPGLLRRIKGLLEAGATVIGAPPLKSPSLSGYPGCDREVEELAAAMWGETPSPERAVGKGRLIRPAKSGDEGLYPEYDVTARILAGMGVSPDFEADASLRYTHRKDGDTDIYFIANREDRPVSATCRFRVTGRQPEWWDAVTGECRELPEHEQADGRTSVPVTLAPHGSGFVVFRERITDAPRHGANFPEVQANLTLSGPWDVSFDPEWGGPEHITFDRLEDWKDRPEPGIRHYSGRAFYRTTFDLAPTDGRRYLSLGTVNNIASVRLNGRDLGTAWCAPWRVEIPAGTLRATGNRLEVTVCNLWVNRLIGDAALPAEKRLAWTTWNPYGPDTPLQPSGLLGPVEVVTVIGGL